MNTQMWKEYPKIFEISGLKRRYSHFGPQNHGKGIDEFLLELISMSLWTLISNCLEVTWEECASQKMADTPNGSLRCQFWFNTSSFSCRNILQKNSKFVVPQDENKWIAASLFPDGSIMFQNFFVQ